LKIVRVTSQDLHANLMAGGQLEFILEAEVGSRHLVWDGNNFVKGEVMGDPKIGIPMSTRIPHLFHLLDAKEKAGDSEPVFYLSNGLGVGIIYPNVV
jgi:hypothetical protein